MEKRKKLISNIMIIAIFNLLIIAIMTIAYMSNYDVKRIIAGAALVVIVDVGAALNIQANKKEHAKVEKIVKNALSENTFTVVAASEENKEAYLFDFLEEVCTLYATLKSEDEVQIIAEITVNDQSVRKEYKVVSFEEFVEQYIVLS